MSIDATLLRVHKVCRKRYTFSRQNAKMKLVKKKRIKKKSNCSFCAQVLMAIKLTHMESIVLHQLARWQYNFHRSQWVCVCAELHIAIADSESTILTFFRIATADPVLSVDLVNFTAPPDTNSKEHNAFTFFCAMQRKWHMRCAHHIDHLECAAWLLPLHSPFFCFFPLSIYLVSFRLWASWAIVHLSTCIGDHY